jgi:hypothetical protein
MSASPSSSTFEWTLERFPDLRLATAIVESPRTLLATLFGVPANNLPADIHDVATYDGLFDTTKQWVVVIEKALIAAAPATPRVGAVRRPARSFAPRCRAAISAPREDVRFLGSGRGHPSWSRPQGLAKG